MEIHHYTKASTLPLILKSGKLRFTRADCLDDLEELPFEAFHLSRQAYFINSWAKSDVEISGQWYRYGDEHRGVRLSFKRSPFPSTKLKFELSRTYLTAAGEKKKIGLMLDDASTPYVKETMFGDGFLLVPWGDEISFGGDVSYTDDPAAYVEKFISSTSDKTEVIGGSEISRVKAKHWQDQSEYRFVLMACKAPAQNYRENPDKYENELLDLTQRWQSSGIAQPPPEVLFIDLPIDTSALDQMTVTLGSGISSEDRKAVLQSIERYAPNAIVLESQIQTC